MLELHGRPPAKYAQKVADKMFTREELIDTVFAEDGSHLSIEIDVMLKYSKLLKVSQYKISKTKPNFIII